MDPGHGMVNWQRRTMLIGGVEECAPSLEPVVHKSGEHYLGQAISGSVRRLVGKRVGVTGVAHQAFRWWAKLGKHL